MKFDLTESLANWRKDTSDRVKLQHVYLVLAVGSVIVAGLVGLVNYAAGQRLVTLGLIALGVYLVNVVAWALVDGLLLVRIDRSSKLNVANRSNAKSATKSRSTKK